ncbi:unnamed protein product, partial [marine sediment metagenome]
HGDKYQMRLQRTQPRLSDIKLQENFGFKPIANLGNLHSDDENDLFYILDLTKTNDLSKNE